MKHTPRFDSDYMQTAHPKVMEALASTSGKDFTGYGLDEICRSAKDRIARECGCEDAEVFFLEGGTQTNAVVIGALLHPYEGVIAPATGHISVHESGAIEAGGHKVLALPHRDGKLSADDVRKYIKGYYDDANYEHMVSPGMLYITQPTEFGTMYSLEELKAFRSICDKWGMPLYMDGARLAYALAADRSITLKDYASLCDVFYIGGTKCGAMLGEAVVFPRKRIPRFFSTIKQNGALLAKGWVLGVQFDALFTDGLYYECGKNGIETALALKGILKEKGYRLYVDSPTNQQFIIVDDSRIDEMRKVASFEFWDRYDDAHTVIRFVTSWATRMEDVLALRDAL